MYLGLVLAGGSPQIFSQQIAYSKNGKPAVPCGEQELRQEAARKFAEIGLAEPYVYILPRLSSIILREGYSVLGNFSEFDIDAILNKSVRGKKPEFKISFRNIASPANVYFTEDLLRNVGTFADITGRTGCAVEKFGCSPFELKLRLNADGFFAQIKYTRKSADDAKRFAEAYRVSLNSDICQFSNSTPLKALFINTNVSHRNNQVFVVTRLPRASIDPPLAKTQSSGERVLNSFVII